MVRFFGYGLVWNPKQNKVICEFKEGIFETDDVKVIKFLKDQGYNFEEIAPAVPPVPPEQPPTE